MIINIKCLDYLLIYGDVWVGVGGSYGGNWCDVYCD